jgi:hypothetical protein
MPDPDRPLPALLPPDLRPVPAPFEPAWALIQEREQSEPMRRALYLVAQGISPNRAAKLAGYSAGTTVHVYSRAQHYGIYRPKAEQIAQQALEVAHMTGESLISALDQDQIGEKMLPIVWGISQDKIIKREQNAAKQAQQLSQYGSALEQLLSDHLDRGGSFSLQVNAHDPLDHAKPVEASTDQD